MIYQTAFNTVFKKETDGEAEITAFSESSAVPKPDNEFNTVPKAVNDSKSVAKAVNDSNAMTEAFNRSEAVTVVSNKSESVTEVFNKSEVVTGEFNNSEAVTEIVSICDDFDALTDVLEPAILRYGDLIKDEIIDLHQRGLEPESCANEEVKDENLLQTDSPGEFGQKEHICLNSNKCSESTNENTHNKQNMYNNVSEDTCTMPVIMDDTENPVTNHEADVKQEAANAKSAVMEELDLYADHEVKEEMTIGPVVFQRQFQPVFINQNFSRKSSRCRFCCKLCKRYFSTKMALQKHKRIHVAAKSLSCEKCHKTFTYKSRLDQHRALHAKKLIEDQITSKNKFNTQFLNKPNIHIQKLPYECERCAKTFALKSNLIRHLDAHQNGEVTNEKSNEINAVVMKVRPHNVVDNSLSFEIKIRDRDIGKANDKVAYNVDKFVETVGINSDNEARNPRRSILEKRHDSAEKTNSNLSCIHNFSCDICNKKFDLEINLVCHLRLHGDKIFQCNICSKMFTRKCFLEFHKHSHKTYNCKKCGNEISSNNLKSHECHSYAECNMKTINNTNNVRSEEKKDNGSTRFKTKTTKRNSAIDKKNLNYELISHLRTRSNDTPNNVTNTLPKKKFDQKKTGLVPKKMFNKSTMLVENSESHENAAKRPQTIINSGETYKIPLKTNSNRIKITENNDIFTCNICHKVFTEKFALVAHERSHANGSSLACGKCHKTYHNKGCLIKHKRYCKQKLAASDYQTYSCDICKEQFSKQCYLNTHQLAHSCKYCKKKFSEDLDLFKHRDKCKQRKTSGSFSCDICAKVFSDNKKLLKHKWCQHSGNLFTCHECSANFKRKSLLVRHMVTHTGIRPFQCNKCHKAYTRKEFLKEHLIKHKTANPFQCKICKKQYANKINYKNHINGHIQGRLTNLGERSNQILHKCQSCELTFKSKTSCLLHLSSHYIGNNDTKENCETFNKSAHVSTEKGPVEEKVEETQNDIAIINTDNNVLTAKPLQAANELLTEGENRLNNNEKINKVTKRLLTCQTCKNHFKNKSKLDEHFTCDICLTVCTQKYNLIRHFRNHSANRQYSCTSCDKRFLQHDYLRDHELTHVGLKPYSCADCEMTFCSVKLLNKHRGERKTSSQKYCCNLCNQVFKSQVQWTRHMTRNHYNKEFKCHICSKEFSYNHDLKYHMLVHEGDAFACEYCGKTFNRRELLVSHISHSHSEVLCEVCNEKFDSKFNLLRHKRFRCIKRAVCFTCDICSNDFASKSSLVCHLRIHAGFKPLTCEVCKKKFRYSWSLAEHLRRHFAIKKIKN